MQNGLLFDRAGVKTQGACVSPVLPEFGKVNVVALIFFFFIVALTLAITYWAAKRTKTSKEFYAAGRSVSAVQNGLALAGDYMSAASFL